MKQIIHCCGCDKLVAPRLTDGKEIYPHREDLHELPFWKCDECGNHVGCHHKTKQRTKPLGCIPTTELKEVRKKIHAVLDQFWKLHGLPRATIYAKLSDVLGKPYHTAEIRTTEEAKTILCVLEEIRNDFKR